MQLTVGKGGALATVNSDGTVNVVSIPMNCSITLSPQRGFGEPTSVDTSVPLAQAESDINTQLSQIGAQ